MPGGLNRGIRVMCAFLMVVMLPFSGFSGPNAGIASAVSIMPGDDGAIVQDESEPSVVKVESVEDFTIALRSDGTVWAWGQNYAGQLGSGDVSNEPRLYPRKVGLENVFIRDIAAGSSFVLALDHQGHVWQWGCFGKDFSTCVSHAPLTSPTLVTVDGSPLIAEEIDAGYYIAMVRTAAGEVWTWGNKRMAGWGDVSSSADDGEVSLEPSRVVDESGTLTDVVQIAAGHDLSMVRKSDGTVHLWGSNVNRVLGVPGDTSLKLYTATRLDLPNGAVASHIAASSASFSSIVVTNQGVYGWALSGGNLGLGNANSHEPQLLPLPDGLKDIAIGFFHVYAITEEGELIRTSSESYGTVTLTEFNGAVSIFAGFKRLFALDSAGTILTAGDHYYGASQAGTNETIYAYNLLGNGRMGRVGYGITWEDDPLPMLAFDALPPAPKYVDVEQSGRSFEIYFSFPLGEYDKVHVKLYDASDNLIGEKEIDHDEEYDLWGYYDSPLLDPGHYRFDVFSHDTRRNKTSHITSVHVELKPVKRTLVLYGAPADQELDLEIEEFQYGEQTVIEDVEVTRFPYYSLYEFYGYPSNPYRLTLNTPGYYLDRDMFEFDADGEIIFEAFVLLDTEPEVYDDLWIEEGMLYGELRWRDPDVGADAVEDYRLSITDAAGEPIMDLDFDYDETYEIYEFYNEQGIDIPNGGAYLRLFMIDGNGEQTPTRFRKWIETELQLPNVTLVDEDSRVDRLNLEVSFSREVDESRLVFYKISLGKPSSWFLDRPLALIPTGQPFYVSRIPELEMYPDESLKIQLIDIYGNTSHTYQWLDVVDNMTDQSGIIPYPTRYGSEYVPADLPDPVFQPIVDTNPYPGHVSGSLILTRPSGSENYHIYDVFYGDREGNIIGGLVRLRHPVEAPETVEYSFDQPPEGAESLVIVGIRFVGYYREYDVSKLVIPLDDTIIPGDIVRLMLNLTSEEPVTLSRVAWFVLMQLSEDAPIDVTGDRSFDRDDVRALLEVLSD